MSWPSNSSATRLAFLNCSVDIKSVLCLRLVLWEIRDEENQPLKYIYMAAHRSK